MFTVWSWSNAPPDMLCYFGGGLHSQSLDWYWQTWLLDGSHAAPPMFGTVFPHLYALLTVSLVLGLSSRHMFARHL